MKKIITCGEIVFAKRKKKRKCYIDITIDITIQTSSKIHFLVH